MRKNYDLGPMEKTSKKKVIREGRGRVYNIKKGQKSNHWKWNPGSQITAGNSAVVSCF